VLARNDLSIMPAKHDPTKKPPRKAAATAKASAVSKLGRKQALQSSLSGILFGGIEDQVSSNNSNNPTQPDQLF
jgi:hypothetical protein